VSAYTYLSFFATFFRIVFIVQYYEYPFESDIMFDLHPELFNLAGACDAAGSEQRQGSRGVARPLCSDWRASDAFTGFPRPKIGV
jgi:hypothetical protein